MVISIFYANKSYSTTINPFNFDTLNIQNFPRERREGIYDFLANILHVLGIIFHKPQ